MEDLFQIGNQLVTKDMQRTHLVSDRLTNSNVVTLNRNCIVRVKDRTLNGPPSVLRGMFISDRGKWVKFKSNSGYLECINKWDLKFGGYRVEYL